MRGRKRNFGVKRKPNGRIANPTKAQRAETEAEAKSVVRAQRYAQHPDNSKDTPLMQAYIAGQIDDRQLEAGELFGAMHMVLIKRGCTQTQAIMDNAASHIAEMFGPMAIRQLSEVCPATPWDRKPVESPYLLKAALAELAKLWRLNDRTDGVSAMERTVRRLQRGG